MSRKKHRRAAKLVPASSASTSPRLDEDNCILVNKLTVADARQMLRNEGGELTTTDLVVGVATTGAMAALLARAIVVGKASAWQLIMPSLAQYLALLVAVPAAYVVTRHPGLKKDALGALAWLFVLMAAPVVSAAARGYEAHIPWREQLASDASFAWNWITESQIHWPMLAAVVSMLAEFPRRVRNLLQHGPPFMGVGMGCAARLIVPIFGCFLVPVLAANPQMIRWYVWGVIVASEGFALWIVWDVQRRLRVYDGMQARKVLAQADKPGRD